MRKDSMGNIYPRVKLDVNPQDIYRAVTLPDIPGMEIKDVRRESIRRLIRNSFFGKQKAFADAIGRQPDYISRILKGTKNLGEELARDIETKLGLPTGWMDQAEGEEACAPGRPPTLPDYEWIRLGESLSREQRQAIIGIAKQMPLSTPSRTAPPIASPTPAAGPVKPANALDLELLQLSADQLAAFVKKKQLRIDSEFIVKALALLYVDNCEQKQLSDAQIAQALANLMQAESKHD